MSGLDSSRNIFKTSKENPRVTKLYLIYVLKEI